MGCGERETAALNKEARTQRDRKVVVKKARDGDWNSYVKNRTMKLLGQMEREKGERSRKKGR